MDFFIFVQNNGVLLIMLNLKAMIKVDPIRIDFPYFWNNNHSAQPKCWT